jgi:hypothetical protein
MAHGPVLDPAMVAGRLAKMSLGRVAARAERVAAEAALLERVSGMSLEELRRSSSARQWLAALGQASGASEPEVAALCGLRGGKVSAHRLLRHPVVVRLVQLIREHQLALVLRGDFGAQASARAAAPAVVEHLTELAGAQRERDGTRRGRAGRDRDAIAAGQVVLDVAGVRVQRHQHQHVHQVLLEEMSDGELEAFSTTGAWPTRLQTALGTADPFTPLPALPAPTVNGAVAAPVRIAPHARSGGRR